MKRISRTRLASCLAAALLLWGCKSATQAPQGGREPRSQAQPQSQPQTQPQPTPAPPARAPAPATPPAQGQVSTPAGRLAAMINAQRAQSGLALVPLSRSLTAVAEAHVRDLQARPPSGSCNLHSWSAGGAWTACCYTSDHAQARCMWNKPAEITGGRYRGQGFEIAGGGSGRMTPEIALDGWRGSSAHFAVIMNQGIWASSTWRALGVALSENYVVAWFGTEVDPDR